jgi:DNA invertase Pin-like site-specific DNA recombinase
MPPRTIAEIVADVLRIQPTAAYAMRGSAAAIELCATPIYQQVIQDDGSVITLEMSEGRYAAGYIRVSSVQQKDDGWSIDDQAERCVRWFVQQGKAFRIFSDSGLSGKLPIDDNALIARMRHSCALRYEEAYRAVLMSELDRRFEADWPTMERWLKDAVKCIRSGSRSVTGATDALDVEVPKVQQGHTRKRHGYRPGLTELMRQVRSRLIHTLAVTDVSRLARSQSLTQQLADEIQFCGVNVVGLIESLEWMAGKGGMGGQLSATVLSIIAEYRLREVCVGSIRGVVTILSSGRAHASLPHWCERDQDGIAVPKESEATKVRAIVRYALQNPNLGYQAIASYCNDHPDEFPPPSTPGQRRERGYWHWHAVKQLLTSPTLAGKQETFGREWNVLPALVSEEEYSLLQTRRAVRATKRFPPPMKQHLMAYLMRCSCGRSMHYNVRETGFKYYTCELLTRRGGGSDVKHHARIDAVSVEEFFHVLMRENPGVLLSVQNRTPEREAISAEIENLRLELRQRRDNIPVIEMAARSRAEADLRGTGRNPSDASVTVLADDDEELMTARQQLADVEKEIERRQYLLDSLLPDDQIAALSERMSRWDSSSDQERNALLRRLVYSIAVETDAQGAKSLNILPNTPHRNPLPPILLKRTNLGRGYRRTAPTLAEWFESWLTTSAVEA